MNITKLELCNRVSKRVSDTDASLPVSYLKPVLETFLDEILSILSEGRRIEIRGFGSFKTKSRKTRIGRNPRTGDKVQIPAHTLPAFKFSRDAVKIFSDKIIGKKKPVALSVEAQKSLNTGVEQFKQGKLEDIDPKFLSSKVSKPSKNTVKAAAENFTV